jgi:spermidine/putrescine transport system substrate-binding protein
VTSSDTGTTTYYPPATTVAAAETGAAEAAPVPAVVVTTSDTGTTTYYGRSADTPVAAAETGPALPPVVTTSDTGTTIYYPPAGSDTGAAAAPPGEANVASTASVAPAAAETAAAAPAVVTTSDTGTTTYYPPSDAGGTLAEKPAEATTSEQPAAASAEATPPAEAAPAPASTGTEATATQTAAATESTPATTQVAAGPEVPMMALPKLSGELHVLNWQGYGTDEAWAVEIFTQRTGVKVTHDYFNSEQEMLTKLRTSPGAYDVVLINSSFTPQAAAEGLIQPIDTGKITNFKDLNPQLRDAPVFVKDGKVYGISWVWGVTSIAYNTDVVTDKPDTIDLLWDAKYAGKVGWRDDAVEAVQMGALATGQDMNNPADLDKIKEKLKALKPQLKTFWSSEDEWNKAFAAHDFDVSVYWSGSAARSKKAFGLPVAFLVPKEGAIGWFDGLSIATNAPNPDAAHAFIDFMVSPEFYVRWDTSVGAPASANTVALGLEPADAFNRTVMGDPELQKRLQFMAPMPDERRKAFTDLWEEVKTYFTQ